MATLRQVGQTILFKSVERTITEEARTFRDRFTLMDVDDLIGHGHLVFMSCYDSYDEDSPATFKSWFVRRLRYEFYDLLRSARRRRCELSTNLDDIPVDIEWPNLDARDPPADAKVVLDCFAKLRPTGKDMTPRKVGAVLRKLVRHKFGGSRTRAERAWASAERYVKGGVA